MFARCPRATSRCLYRARIPPAHPRFTSSVPERTRKLPNTRNSFFSKLIYDWLLNRWFLFGVVSGSVLTAYATSRGNDSFATYTLASKEPVSSTASIFHLHPKRPSENYEIYKGAWRRGIWNVQFKQPQLQIVRAYTPLPPLDQKSGNDNGEVRFLIRHDPHGEVSSWLHRMPLNADLEMRGPYLEYEITPEVQQVIFFAGGTGIAPALQVAHALFEGDQKAAEGEGRKGRKLHILWANRSREDCVGGVDDEPSTGSLPHKSTWTSLFTKAKAKPPPPLSAEKGLMVQELEALKRRHPGQITVEYFVNAEDTWIDEDAVFRALSRLDDKDFSASSSASDRQRQILISGPPGFIAHLAGPKEWKNGREEQGAVSKIVAHALSKNPHNVEVWKI